MDCAASAGGVSSLCCSSSFAISCAFREAGLHWRKKQVVSLQLRQMASVYHNLAEGGRAIPFLDRFWQIRLLLAGVLLASASALIVWAFSALMPFDSAIVQRITPVSAFAVVAALCLVACASYAARAAMRARDRKQRRLAAISGEQDRLSLASSPYIGSATPTIGEEQTLSGTLSLSFRATLLALLAALVCLVGFVVSVTYVSTIIWTTLDGDLAYQTQFIGARLAPPVFTGLFALSALGVIVCAVGLWASFRAALYLTPFTITLNAEGITWRIHRRPPIRLRWSDLLLLEVAHLDTPNGYAQLYRLYSQRAAIRWMARSAGLAGLPALISAQTGLALRTLDPTLTIPTPNKLAATPAPARPSSLHRMRAYALGLALYQIFFTGVTLALPPSHNATINHAVTYAMTFGALVLLALFVGSLAPPPRNHPPVETIPPPLDNLLALHLTDDPQAVYRFDGGMPRNVRLLTFAVGAPLALGVAPLALWAVRYAVLSSARSSGELAISELAFGVVFGLPTLFGCLMVWFNLPVVGRRSVLRADALGLAKLHPTPKPGEGMLGWNEIRSLVVRVESGRILSFVAMGQRSQGRKGFWRVSIDKDEEDDDDEDSYDLPEYIDYSDEYVASLKQRGYATDYYEHGEHIEREAFGPVQSIIWPDVPGKRRMRQPGITPITARELAALVISRARVTPRIVDVTGKLSKEIAAIEYEPFKGDPAEAR